ncbi:MAG: hypothetical protein HY516_02075 [Candidatus Aenigmarchaeota archaeon]|nr:hypothetical protein [Candidatus Aenigmarchaeota archaeon]
MKGERLTIKLTIIGLLLAMIFGISTFYGDKRLPVGFDLFLAVLSKSMIPISSLFFIYIVGLAGDYKNYSYKRGYRWYNAFYDLGVVLSTFTVAFSALITFVLYVSGELNSIPLFIAGLFATVLVVFYLIRNDLRRSILDLSKITLDLINHISSVVMKSKKVAVQRVKADVKKRSRSRKKYTPKRLKKP